ncbi:hypothetical protein HHK36_006413 [Tetracentron sinense]|uniref:Protein kinase domain-containing protein n=1 Tax=Tetracentron sinense TaxID=13715 RepID=A0A834ZPK5_TETSI|nr:hypothetical protein HHK36_006413 [Tetracentron sinense]
MKRKNFQNNGVGWTRGELIGQGSFGTVSLATNTRPNTRHNLKPPTMAVKWAELTQSSSLEMENQILSDLHGCPHILRCYGGEITNNEKGQQFYNLLLEYGSGGSLADHIKSSSSGLTECSIRHYTRSILRGLVHIHERGYVHCDIKPENVILVPAVSTSEFEFDAKIADFGLARKVEKNKKRKEAPCFRGTALYMSPESITIYKQEPCMDIWALGCVVIEMITGKPAWHWGPDTDVKDLLFEIAYGGEMPKMPSGLSDKGKDFLHKCFARDSWLRWTAEMLLNHPFIAEDDDDDDVEDSQGVLKRRCTVKETPSLFYMWNHILKMSCYASKVEEEMDVQVVGSPVQEERAGALKRRRTTTDVHITLKHLSCGDFGAASHSNTLPPGFEQWVFRNRRSNY